ncbi:MAG: glutaminyl-peptide cyclotransferase [Blastomonas sp.]
MLASLVLSLAGWMLGCAPLAAQDDAPATAREPFRIIACYPHDTTAFTQGLFYRNGSLFESTGHVGRSSIREVRIEDGAVLRSAVVPGPHFGEGSVDWGDEIISLTWRSGVGFRWGMHDFRQQSQFSYRGEGWGLTRNDHQLIMSDGSDVLRFLDPRDFSEQWLLEVTLDGAPLRRLNELEWVDGMIWANVWMAEQIVVIDPASGIVTEVVDFAPVARAMPWLGRDQVLNGIAYDAAGGRLFITGKEWPWLFELRRVAEADAPEEPCPGLTKLETIPAPD